MPSDVGEDEARHPARGEDDHEPGGAEELLHRGSELAHPQEVEDDVEQAPVEIDGGEERPPPARPPRRLAGHAERHERAGSGREQVERAPGRCTAARGRAGWTRRRPTTHTIVTARAKSSRPISRRGERAEAPQPGPPRPAVEADRGVHAVELAARVAEAGAGALPQERPGGRAGNGACASSRSRRASTCTANASRRWAGTGEPGMNFSPSGLTRTPPLRTR